MLPLGLYLYLGSAAECTWMVSKSQYGTITTPAMVGCIGVMSAAVVPVLWPLSGEPYPGDCLLGPLGWPLAAASIALVGSFAWLMPSYKPNQNFFIRAILAGWVAVYFGISFAFAIGLRMIGPPAWGLYLLVGVIVSTKFADAGAYFCGRALGKHKLCPNVSPGKTIEGLVGGMLVSIMAAWVYFKVCGPLAWPPESLGISAFGIVLLGVAVTLSGVLGDLLAFIFKRETGCKDSGRLLPGLGGIWDVTDSLIPAVVVAYLIVMTGLIEGPGIR